MTDSNQGDPAVRPLTRTLPLPFANKINPPVFVTVAVLTLLFVLFSAMFTDLASAASGALYNWVTAKAGWFYVLVVTGFLAFVTWLALSRFGSIKLGPDDSTPDYSYAVWFAMLFSAGIGIGLMFFGVAEPVTHLMAPPIGDAQSVEAARQAMRLTLFHWGLHGWAIYAAVALSLGYFAFRHGLPLTIRSSLYPLIGDRIYGPIGHAVDVFAVLGTLFGVATSLGLGVMQINAGLNYLFDVPILIPVQIGLIAMITLIATGSVVLGLNGGIRRLSIVNMVLASSLLMFVLLAGPTALLLKALMQNTGNYTAELLNMTLNLYAYQPNDDWLSAWTLFYWGWWIAWAPFVGMFIARVSRGRRIREFVVGVLLVPLGFTLMWMTFFGNTAIDMIMHQGLGALADSVAVDSSVALFQFLEQLPWSGATSLLATILVVTFFVTSSDSGSLVVDTLTSGGASQTPTWQRIFWAILEGLIAAVLLTAGGLAALQTATVVSALPFAVIMILMCWGLLRALRRELPRA
jgi:choline/glycine/proline betaine transport protein